MFRRLLFKVYNSLFSIRSKSEMFRIRLQDLIGITRKGHFGIYLKLLNHLNSQKRLWKRSYSRGYFYQGYEELGINGTKPTGYRFHQYNVDSLLRDSNILDIGSNNGFVSIYCARLGKTVTGIEYNPYLINIVKDVSTYLGVLNTNFIQDDFTQIKLSMRFDIILSLSNHHTIDGGLNLGFEDYLRKIFGLLNPKGYLLFESHNVYGPG